MTVHVLYENPDWMPPLREALHRLQLPVEEHVVLGGVLDLVAKPRPGVYLNRMSPSAHTRDHQAGVAFLREYLAVLELHGRRVVNGSRAFALEISKVQQDAALQAAGILTPATVAAVGGDLSASARRLDPPFISKHNQGGKGLGVQLFRDHSAFDTYVHGDDFIESPDGVTLVQQYIEPPEPYVTRVEIVDGQFQYAIRSSTAGGFELCPADACVVDDAFCPVGDTGTFSLATDITGDDPLVRSYIRFMNANAIDVAGIEFVQDAAGQRFTYDVNGTTNFNSAVESAHGLDGMGAIARLAAWEVERGRDLGEIRSSAA